MTRDTLRQPLAADDAHQRLSELIAASPLAVITMDEDSVVTGWNPAAEAMFGWTAAEAIGRTAPHSGDTFMAHRHALRHRLRNDGGFAGQETRRQRKDGTIIDVAISAAPLRDTDGVYRGSICLIEDIAPRRRAEAEREAAAERTRRHTAALAHVAASETLTQGDWAALAALVVERTAEGLSAARVGIWRLSADGAAIVLDAFHSNGGETLPAGLSLGLEACPAYADALRSGRTIAADDALNDPRSIELADSYLRPSGIGAMLDSPIRIGRAVQGVLCVEHVGGCRAWTSDEQSFAASMADLCALGLESAERHRTLARLEAALARAEAAGRAKSQFLANMGHELRTPLNAIIGFADLLRDDFAPGSATRSHAQDIGDAGRHLLAIINDVLTFTRSEHSALRLSEGRVRVATLVEEAIRLVNHMAVAGHVTIETAAQPAVVLRADGPKLRQALINLLSNAIKFSHPGGTVTVEVEFNPERDVVVSVIDRGIGMKPDLITQAFEPFVQLHAGLARPHEGTGLGLPLSRALVELHGGSLDLESAPHHGTTASIRLPVRRVIAGHAAAPMALVSA